MKLINFGSMNIDKVYTVENSVKDGETISALDYKIFTGGKGLNQSAAASKAGMRVLHAGALGTDGTFLSNFLTSVGVDVSCICKTETETGHAVIQVNALGQNAILVYGGANRELSCSYIDNIIENADKDDIVLLQNETNNVDYIIRKAHEKGLKTAWNPSPFPHDIETIPSELVDIFFVNEIEGALLAETESDDYSVILKALEKRFEGKTIVLTLGANGVLCCCNGIEYSHKAFEVKAVDTTAAGDTFTGYFLSCMSQGLGINECLERACAASAIAVSRKGAAPSIPSANEVSGFLEQIHCNNGYTMKS